MSVAPPAPDRLAPRTLVYGKVSPALLRQVARAYLANRERQRSRIVPRTV